MLLLLKKDLGSILESNLFGFENNFNEFSITVCWKCLICYQNKTTFLQKSLF